MLLDPLHPALVHFPIVRALLAPLLAAGSPWAIHDLRLVNVLERPRRLLPQVDRER